MFKGQAIIISIHIQLLVTKCLIVSAKIPRLIIFQNFYRSKPYSIIIIVSDVYNFMNR